jgi:hypothetical protein
MDRRRHAVASAAKIAFMTEKTTKIPSFSQFDIFSYLLDYH